MTFEVSTAKREILQKLTERAWTPTDLADELDKSRNTVYNHLQGLHEQGILTKTKVAAKTRPRTEYSIGDGFMQYIAALPGQYTERTLELTPEKRTVLRIWAIPQEAFHPYVRNYWWSIQNDADLDYREDVRAISVYGSVARGEADEASDIDFLVVTRDEDTAATVTELFGSVRIDTADGSKIGMTEVYSTTEYRNSLVHDSSFLDNVRDEHHVLYDPDDILRNPETVLRDEQ